MFNRFPVRPGGTFENSPALFSGRSPAPWLAVVAVTLCAPCSAAEQLSYPVSIAVNRSGVIYLADRDLPGVWRLEGDRLSLFFKGSKKFRTPLNAVRCVAVDREGKLLAGDSATSDVYRFDDQGTPQPLTARGKPYGRIGIPMAIVTDADGNLLVSDLETHRIVKVPKEGGPSQPFAAVPAPRGLFYDSHKQLWVISGRKLVRVSGAGEPKTIVDDGVFLFPHAVVVKDDGVAYVCDGYAKTIWKVPQGQKPEKWVSGSPLDNPVGMDLRQGRLLVVDPRAKAVFEIDEKGKLTRREARLAGQ
jgi:sugar lactone lactonase YvrE